MRSKTDLDAAFDRIEKLESLVEKLSEASNQKATHNFHLDPPPPSEVWVGTGGTMPGTVLPILNQGAWKGRKELLNSPQPSPDKVYRWYLQDRLLPSQETE